MNREIFFFIGTEAELIKVFPVILECKKQNLPYRLIASGQNDIIHSQILQTIDCGGVSLELSQEKDITKSAVGLATWFIKTKKNAAKKIRDAFPQVDYKRSLMIVHGDTVSTMMGAMVGKKLGMTVGHVEAGLRSHNIFNPFPEELDRMFTSRRARIHFAPGKVPSDNLKNAKGKVVDTQYNTILDSLNYSYQVPLKSEIKNYINDDYFVFVMHRQENLMNDRFVKEVVNHILQIAENKKCIIILHEITRVEFEKIGILENLGENPHVVLQPRVDYFDFMKLLYHAEFVITDGGSNQEELHYMGKPCLIMRKTTERNEGIGQNAVMFGGDLNKITEFAEGYKNMQIEPTKVEISPSEIICDSIENFLENDSAVIR